MAAGKWRSRASEQILAKTIANCGTKDCENELLKYLLCYRSTPHSVTGVTPAKLLLNRELRDKIPSLEGYVEPDLEGIRDRDAILKCKGKEYSDGRAQAKESNINVGDRMFIPA